MLFIRRFCDILPDVGDVIAETCRTDGNFTCLFELCEYFRFKNKTEISVYLGSDPRFILGRKASSCMEVRVSRRLHCRKCTQNSPAQNFMLNNKFYIMFTVLEA